MSPLFYAWIFFAFCTRSSASAVWVANAVRSCLLLVITPSGSAGFTPIIPSFLELKRGIYLSRTHGAYRYRTRQPPRAECPRGNSDIIGIGTSPTLPDTRQAVRLPAGGSTFHANFPDVFGDRRKDRTGINSHGEILRECIEGTVSFSRNLCCIGIFAGRATRILIRAPTTIIPEK